MPNDALTANPYADLMDQEAAGQDAQFKASAALAVTSNPDKIAQQRRVAGYLGMPPAAVEALPEQSEQQAKVQRLDQDTAAAPTLRRQYTDQDFAKLAHDDSGVLSQIESTLRAVTRGGVAGYKTEAKAFGGFLKDSAAQVGLGATAGLGAWIFDAAGVVNEAIGKPLQALGQPDHYNPFLKMASDARAQASATRGAMKELTPEGEGNIAKGYWSGLQSLGSNLALLPAGAAAQSGSVLAGLMSGFVGAQAYTEARMKGLEPVGAATYAIPHAAFEYAFEKLPASRLLEDLAKGSGLWKTAARQLVPEVLGEQATTVLQDLNDWTRLNPEKTLSEFAAERPDAAAQTLVATLVGVAGQSSAVGAINRLSGQRAQAERAEDVAVNLEELAGLMATSKLRERAPESFNAFMAQIAESGEAPTELYVDAEVLANTLNQSAITIEQLRAFAPAAAEQMEQYVPGADIRVPVAEFAAAGPELMTPLLDHLRESPDAMSRAEAKAYLDTQGDKIKAEVETQLAQRQDADAFRAQVQEASAGFEAELNAAGKFRPKVNKAYASLLGNFYASQAIRAGMTLPELMQRYQLRVSSKEGEGAQRLGQDAVLKGDEVAFFNSVFSNEADLSDLKEVAPSARMDGGSLHIDDADMPAFEDWLGEVWGAAKKQYGGEGAKTIPKSFAGAGHAFIKRLHASTLQGEAAFKRDPFSLGGLSLAQAEKIVGELTAGWKNGPKVQVVESYRDLPVQAPRDVRGLYYKGGVWVVANAHRDGPDMRQAVGRTLAHEAVAHYGLREMLGRDGWTELMGNVQKALEGGNAELQEIQAYIRRAYVDEKGEFTLNANLEADEIAARVVENAIDANGEFKPGFEFVKSVYAKIAAFLRELGLDVKFTTAELHGMLVLAQQGMEAGKRAEGGGQVMVAAARTEEGQAARGELNQGEGERGALSFSNDITASPSVMALLKDADLSTFIHEGGHFFLEVQADLATRIQTRISAGEEVSDGERGIVADMDAILGWFGITADTDASALDRWSLMTLEQKREHHEKWARGFERYVMEGKAPSQELQGLFSKFRSWLVSVYKTLAGLNVSLSDDVRAVMDRMLATDEAIAQAQAAQAMGPLFESAEQAGMTPAEYADYQALAERSTAQASAELDARLMKDMKWLSRARDKALKTAQAEADALRKEIELEVRAQVMSQPVYRAWAFLTGKQYRVEPGIQAAETIDPTRQSGKLRTSLLKETHPKQWPILSERRMTSEDNGMDPDIVAEIFEFSSGDEMVQALTTATAPQQLIEELVDRQMLETHGDIASPQALAQAADEAVHNELRARIVATELQAMEKAGTVRAGARSSVNVMAKAARDYAYQVIARQRVRDLRPSQYSQAQARSAKLAQQALGKSTEEVALHKRNELINGYATRAAHDALAEVKALQAYFRKFDKRSKSIDPGYLDQIEQLLEKYDFRPATLKAVDRRKSFAAWYAEQVKDGIEPNVPEQLLEDSGRQSFKDMTVEELRGLRDTVKQIEHLGRLKNKLLLARDKRDFDAIAQEMAASIIEHGGAARPVLLEGPEPVRDWFAGIAASHRKLSSLFRQMDGMDDAGPMYEHIGRAMNERGTMEDVMVEQATVALRALYAPLLKLRGGITGHRSKLWIPEIGASLTRGGRLSVALNWGNEANRQRIMDGDQWSVDQVQAILKTLTPAELEFVNGVWSYIDSYWEQIAAKERRLTGVEPEKVEAVPFNVIAADGTAVAMTGGYFPLKYDTDRSDRADTQEAAQAAKEMMQGAITRATTRRGHTKERLKEVKRAVRKDLNVITQHVTQVVHDLAWHEWLIDTNKLLSDEGVVSAIRAHYGPKVLKSMRDDVLGIATADAAPMTDIDKALLMVRSNVSRSTMGLSLTTAFLQPFGLTQSMVRIGGRHVLRGVARWGGDAVRMENTVGWIQEKSEFMRLRAKTFNRELREIRGSVAGKSQTMRVSDASLFYLMQKMQLVADVPTWVGQYEKSLAEGLDEAAAVAMADRAVLESQGGGAVKDLAEVQRKHPMLTQFYSYFSVTLNLAAESTAATNFRSPAAVAGWLGDMALLMVIPAMLPSLIMFALKGGDGDDEKGMAARLAEWQLSYLMGTVVGLRELTGALSGFDYAGPPVGRVIGDAGKVGKQASQGELDEPAVMAIVNLLGSAFGIPTVQALRSYKGWKAWDEGQEGAGPQSLLFGPPPKH